MSFWSKITHLLVITFFLLGPAGVPLAVAFEAETAPVCASVEPCCPEDREKGQSEADQTCECPCDQDTTALAKCDYPPNTLAAINCWRVAISTPIKQGCAIGGDATRMCT